jgi:glycosyltransferase involved in cell wall biosynthesis
MSSIDATTSSALKTSLLRYAVISPIKDEAGFIEETINSMIRQSVRPAIWVIVNDGSTDATEAIVQYHMQNHNWIRLVNRRDRGIRQRGKGIIEAFYAGLETVVQDYDFIVKLDGDVSFGSDYFACLLSEFVANPRLGIAGGGIYEKPDGKTWRLWTVRDHVRGPTKIYRRACFEEIGGLVPALGWDGIDEWKALAAGWSVQSFLEQKIYHHRPTGGAIGSIHHRIEQGYGAYRMGYHPLYMLARGIRHMADRPYVIGGAAMIGSFFLAWLQKQDLLADPTVVQYIRHTQINKLAGLLSGKPIYE